VSGTLRLEHVFVEHLPERLDDGVLYLALPIGTVAHRCCCGCGLEVVTPLSRTDWSVVYDGETVSLYPSIGNWSFPCRSHYWIRYNEVRWAPRWSQAWIDAGREHDRLLRGLRYGDFGGEVRRELWIEQDQGANTAHPRADDTEVAPSADETSYGADDDD
jgi:hypothetical protein